MKSVLRRILALSLGLVLVLVGSSFSTSAQDLPDALNINTYVCPPDYDQVSDCTKIGGVVVSVVQDGVELGPVTSDAAAGVEVPVTPGVELTATVIEGQPEGTTLEPTNLTFVPEEGLSALTLVFVEDAAPSEPSEPEPTDPEPAPSEPSGPVGLPNTGAGSTTTTESTPVVAMWLMLAAIATASVAWATNHRRFQR